MVVAKRPHAHALLQLQFQNKTTERRYEALVCGVIEPEEGSACAWLSKDANDLGRITVVPNDDKRGRKAVTHYECLEVFKSSNVSLLSLRLETGRTHQIRAHCAWILGAPLLGDVIYGGGADWSARRGDPPHLLHSSPTPQVPSDVVAQMPRQALHARSLSFTHPVTGKRMAFNAPPPPDFESTLQLLRELEQG
eukprot:CAMPEP_0185797024 /NCGR_PEP_ID=MMETSP1174-20130828/161395_1 /TAXON_ID=35687 /ORGANISM="Dictyocha speculum, Strain CCMP1381" /LENGTH=193 /DNA_ID=CAMNT_0028492425 /DNA_START=701 /DNA_END=1285 /DNA_ORIENTATION=+